MPAQPHVGDVAFDEAVEVAAAIVKSNHILKGSELAVVEIRASQFDISQARRSEFSQIVYISRDLKPSGVVILWANAVVVKDIVGCEGPAMTKHAAIARCSEDAPAALLGRRQRPNPAIDLIERRLIAV